MWPVVVVCLVCAFRLRVGLSGCMCCAVVFLLCAWVCVMVSDCLRLPVRLCVVVVRNGVWSACASACDCARLLACGCGGGVCVCVFV